MKRSFTANRAAEPPNGFAAEPQQKVSQKTSSTASESGFDRQLREINEELIKSSVHQHELTEIAERSEEKFRRSEELLREANIGLSRDVKEIRGLNIELGDSRLAALNLMEDAMLARRKAESLNQELQREIAERERAEENLQKQLADTQLLQRLSAAMTEPLNEQGLYDVIVDAAVEIMHSDFASMQMLYPERGENGEVLLLAQRGFNPEGVKHWQWVRADSGSACGETFRTGRRCLVTDVEQCEFIQGVDLASHRDMGMRAVQTTPLTSRAGALIGMISTHWHRPHEPTMRDWQMFDVLARQAADLIERTQAELALSESEERFSKAFNASPLVLTISTLSSGKLIEVNDTFVSTTGYSREEAIGKTTLDLGLWTKSADRNAELEIVRRQGEIANAEYVFRMRDGREIVGLLSAEKIEIAGEPCSLTVIEDITDRKHAQDKLRASETQLRLVTDAIPALISYIDKDERFQFVNRQYSEWFGKTREQFLGKKIRDVIGSRAYALTEQHVHSALSGHEVSFDSWLNFKGAGQRYVHISYVPDLLNDGTIAGLFSLVSDLSDVKRSEDLLSASQERMRLMTESFTDYAIYSMDNEGRIDSWNPGAEQIFGYEENEIIGSSSEILFTPDDVEKSIPLKEMRNSRRNGRSSDERWHIRKDGSRFFASGVMVPLYVGRVLSGYAKIASDLTERKRTAESLQRAHDELEMRVLDRTRELAEANIALRAEIAERQDAEEQKINLLKRLVTSQEDERRRIARDIHDQLGQRLTALRLKIASLREAVGENAELRSRTNRLQEIGELLDSEVSFLAWELRPSAVEELGLTDAIGTFAREWSRHYGIPAEFHSTGMAKLDLDPESDTHLYRIAQEALNNIVKHAHAENVNVLVERADGEVILIVEDDGRGFDRSASKRARKNGKGLGLTGMEERASLIGGKVEIESTIGAGTTVFVRVPLNSRTAKRK